VLGEPDAIAGVTAGDVKDEAARRDRQRRDNRAEIRGARTMVGMQHTCVAGKLVVGQAGAGFTIE